MRFLILLFDDFATSVNDDLRTVNAGSMTISCIWYSFFLWSVFNFVPFVVKTWVKETKISERFSWKTSVEIYSFSNTGKYSLFSYFRNPLISFFNIPESKCVYFPFFVRNLRTSSKSFRFLSSSEPTATFIIIFMSNSYHTHLCEFLKFCGWSIKRSFQKLFLIISHHFKQFFSANLVRI